MDAKEGDVTTAIPDAMLLYRFQQGDEASFTTLFERHYDMVYGVLFRLTGTRAEAEDFLQEVFLRLYERPLHHAENVAGWLYRVAMNTGYNALRAAYRRERRERAAVVGTEQSLPATEEEVTRREARRRVQRTLARLPERAAKLLVLRESGFSYREIAEIVELAEGSVGTLLARAQNAFTKLYQEEGE
jgi:RNA polymerase sigma-70 factor (ECF subfamily)